MINRKAIGYITANYCLITTTCKDMDALMATPLWQAMPLSAPDAFSCVPAVWFYGATLSAMHFVRILDNAIGGKSVSKRIALFPVYCWCCWWLLLRR